MKTERDVCSLSPSSGYTLFLLTMAYLISGLDKGVLLIVIQPIRAEFDLSDTQIGFLSGLSFAIAYSVASVPFGLLADRVNRRTLIACCVTIWSAMTVVSGFAQNLTQLVLTRIGVGIGESGGPPAAMSIIADLYPPERRASAIGLYNLAPPLASLIALAGGGVIADLWGWRTTLIVAGAPGLVLAIIFMLTLREPKRLTVPGSSPASGGLRPTINMIARCRSLKLIIAAGALSAVASSGINSWIAIYLVRTFDVSLSQVGMALGPAVAVASCFGAVAGGYGSDLISKGDDQRRTSILTIASLAAIPFFVGVLLSPTFLGSVACAAAYMVTTFVMYAPMYALIQNLCRPEMRATTVSIVFLILNLVGYGIGSQIVGVISDLIPGEASAASLRVGLLSEAVVAFGACVLFFLTSFSIRQDITDIRET